MYERSQDKSPWLFPSPRLKGERATNFKQTLRIAKAAAGDEEFGYHHCRVFFASQCVMAGIDFRTIASWLGHRDGGILLSKVYAQLSDEHKRHAAAKLTLG
jgi:site-specific recombinase XerD